MSDIIYLAITFDVDHDHYGDETVFSKTLTWRGVGEGIPQILDLLRRYEDSFGSPARSTWFVRVDNQLRDMYGDPGYLLQAYKRLWTQLTRENNEIGWHPHLFKRIEENWTLENRSQQILEILKDGFVTMVEYGYSPVSSRIGGAYHSNEVMLLLEKLGIGVDSTAIPGRIRGDMGIDWLGTPETPYYPSRHNYRKPDENAEENLNILEVPMSMITTKVTYDKRPLKRYVNLSFHNFIMRKGVRCHIRNKDLLVTITHPFELVHGKNQPPHPLISFDVNEMQKNLEQIISECNRIGKAYEFIRLSDILREKQILDKLIKL